MPSGYCAYERVVTAANADEEALAACQALEKEHPDYDPDNWSNNMWGPLHIAVGRRWIETTQWLLPHCKPSAVDDFGKRVWDLCYVGDKYRSVTQPVPPSMDMAKLLTQAHDPRVMCHSLKDGEGDIPLYQMGASWIACDGHPQWREQFEALDAFFLAECKRWQEKTGKGVNGFPVL